MSRFRLETVLDEKTGLYSAEVFYPDDAISPFIRTKPRFISHEAAAQEAVEMFKTKFPDKSVDLSN